MEGFKKLGLSKTSIEAIAKKGYTEPTEIQAKTIPLLLEGKQDIIGQSQTGTGKTASFALPIIEKIDVKNKGIKALILTPTRELAVQITKEFESLSGNKNIKTLTVYGGASITNQMNTLKKGVDIVVGTPGRVIDLIKRRSLVITGIDYCVLDEADEMLNMGFIDDIEIILKKTPNDKKMLLFSATMPAPIKKIAQKFMKEHVLIKTKKQELTIDLIEQTYYNINSRDRFEGIRRIIDITEDFYGIVFCKTKAEVDQLSVKLLNSDYSAGALHGDISQSSREKILAQFKKKNLKILIATDVAARGIDVNDLTHVINYSLPQSPEIYVHRIGRTGRAGKKGIAITFVMPSERNKLRLVEKVAKCKLILKELPQISEVVNVKRNHLEEKLEMIISSKHKNKFNELASKLLDKNNALDVVSALLKFNFGNEEKGYNEIGKVSDAVPKSSSRNRRRSGDSGRSRRFGGNRGKKDPKSQGNNKRSNNSGSFKRRPKREKR